MDREWYMSSPPIKAWLCDITGVLYESGPDGISPIAGSIDAIKRLKAAGVPVKFCTNETESTRSVCAENMCRAGFPVLPEDFHTPAPHVCQMLKERGLRPFLITSKGLKAEFEENEQVHPNCVVIGDATEEFSYNNLNTACRVLRSANHPLLIAMGNAKYYKATSGSRLNTGTYVKLLQWATDCNVEIFGKPSASFFKAAVSGVGIPFDQVIMVGDDLYIDIAGANACGIRTVQVKTGKYRTEDDNHEAIKPTGRVNNLLEAVDAYLSHIPIQQI